MKNTTKPTFAPEHALGMLREGQSYEDIARHYGVSRQAVHMRMVAKYSRGYLKKRVCPYTGQIFLAGEGAGQYSSAKAAESHQRGEPLPANWVTISRATACVPASRDALYAATLVGYIRSELRDGVVHVLLNEAEVFARNKPGRGYQQGADLWRARNGLPPMSEREIEWLTEELTER